MFKTTRSNKKKSFDILKFSLMISAIESVSWMKTRTFLIAQDTWSVQQNQKNNNPEMPTQFASLSS